MKNLIAQKYRGRNPKGYFRELPWEAHNKAYWWLHQFVARWGRDLPAWRFAILVGQAKRLALNPPTSAWGRSMLAKRGGLAVQRKYLLEGRHPTEQATQGRLKKQRRKKAEERFEGSGSQRVAHLSLWD